MDVGINLKSMFVRSWS